MDKNPTALAVRVSNCVEALSLKMFLLNNKKRLTLEGYIVVSVGLFGHSGDNEVWSEGTKEMLDGRVFAGRLLPMQFPKNIKKLRTLKQEMNYYV